MTTTLHAKTAAYPDVTANFRKLASDYFEQVYFKFSPSVGTLDGLHQYDALLEDYSRAGVEQQIAALKRFDALVLSDYEKGLITDEFADRVLNACHRLKVPVFVAPQRSRLYAYRGAKAIVCNLKEAGQFVSRTLSDEKSVEEVGRALLAHFGVGAVLITQGEKGMTLFEESSPRHLNIPATSFEVTYARVGQAGVDRGATGRQVFDVTGAGDTVLSVLALASAAGASLPDAAMLANIAAGVVVGKLGTASVSPAELQHGLDELRQEA